MSTLASISNRPIRRSLLLHAGIWISVYLIYSFILSFNMPYSRALIVNVLNVFLFIIAYYTLKHIQIPFLYDRQRYFLFGASLLCSSVLLFGAYFILRNLVQTPILGYSNDPNSYFKLGVFLVQSIRFYSPAMVLMVWEAQSDRKDELLRIEELEKEQMANELKFLKAQINPHFLFNTLNNLYSYVVNESPKAPDMIMRLSGILDYVLYKSQLKEVPIREELTTIENFLGLEKIRYGDRLNVEYHSEGDLTTPISPLILLSLIENAFKHGASGDIESPLIKIHIRADNDQIHSHVWNTKSKLNGEINDSYKEGIGLSNIKRQLNLIYPDSHKISVIDGSDSFEVNVQININP